MKQLFAIFVTFFILATIFLPIAHGDEYSIPSWVKNTAGWWSQGQVGDSDFTKGIQYLIEQGLVKIPPTSPSSNSSNAIPSWVKNNAKWWSEGSVDDSEFVKGMQYLIQSGIIHINLPQQSTAQPDQQATTSTQATCKSINEIMPDPNCTPGTTDPRVTQDNIQSTICVSGYTQTVRPSTSVTDPIKIESMKAYGYTDSPSNYELDHLIPLELGGAPADIKNLWPEPYYTTITAYNKDGLENYLHDQVCSGTIDLKTAQNEIATNWLKYWLEIHSQSTTQSTVNQATTATQNQPSTSTSQPSQSTQVIQSPSTAQSLGTLQVDLKGQSPITRGNIQSMTVFVTDGTGPVSDATVSVTVYYASGSTTKNFDGTSDSSGQFTFSWRIGGNSTPGTFEVDADSQKDRYVSGHGTFSFEVVPAS
ncbi:MAG: carboxypeptidase-like regulatory domain-containing protein [Nitrosotalea sp.]